MAGRTQYEEAEGFLHKAIEGRRPRLSETSPRTQEALKSLIELYKAWNKPEKAKEWRPKLPQLEDFEE